MQINDKTISHLANKLGLGKNITDRLNSKDTSEIQRINDPCFNIGLVLRSNTAGDVLERAVNTDNVNIRRACMSGSTHRVGVAAAAR